MSIFRDTLRLQKTDKSGQILEEEEIDLRHAILGIGEPNARTEGTKGFSYYDISELGEGVLRKWICVEAGPNGTVWVPFTGEPGKDGESVSVERVTESTEDGGLNMVYFSDGKKVAVRNGRRGETGKGLDIRGTYRSVSALEAAVPEPEQGWMYNIGTAAPYTIYMYDTALGWVSQGQLQGAKGTTFRPFVDADGNITWTNDGGEENPDPSNIRGPAGAAAAIVSVEASAADSGENVITFNDGTKVTIRNGARGSNGVSATHSWNGTVLTITSASGTSSADLKGDKGDTGSADLTLGIKNAKVGQTILVKEVDAAGVPVAWETADMDTSHIGGAGETEIQTISEHNMYRHILSGEYYGSVESGRSVLLETDENEDEINAYAIGVIIQEMEQITDVAAIYVKFEGMNEYIKMCTLPFLKAASILITPQIYWGCEIIPFSEGDTWKKVMSVLPYNNQKITGVKVTGVEKIDIELWEILQ